jgi:hypothetical protein
MASSWNMRMATIGLNNRNRTRDVLDDRAQAFDNPDHRLSISAAVDEQRVAQLLLAYGTHVADRL